MKQKEYIAKLNDSQVSGNNRKSKKMNQRHSCQIDEPQTKLKPTQPGPRKLAMESLWMKLEWSRVPWISDLKKTKKYKEDESQKGRQEEDWF